MKKKLGILFGVIWLVLILGACEIESEPKTTWTFENVTNRAIFITDINGSPSSVNLAAYAEKTVEVSDDVIVFDYEPKDFVAYGRVYGKNTIQFVLK